MYAKKLGILVCLILLFATGCATKSQKATTAIATPNFFGIGEELTRQLIKNRRNPKGYGERLIFTTMVNLNKLDKTSKFGRILSESLGTNLFKHGYGVEEIRKISTILVKDNYGELVLSRDAAKLAKQHNCDLIVAGTYAVTPSTVIINVKFLDALSSEVLSVAGMELQRSTAINYLLADKKGVFDAKLSSYEE